MSKNTLTVSLIGAGAVLVGLAGGIAGMASAQTATVTPAPTTVTTAAATTGTAVDTPESANDPVDSASATDTPESANDPADTGSGAQQHAPLGGDGTVSSINGSTIVIGEESGEGGASYTVDASKATVTVNGAAGTLSDIKAGEKVFVKGAVNGTNVTATSVSVGHGGEKDSANDTDGSAASEGSEAPGAAGSSNQ